MGCCPASGIFAVLCIPLPRSHTRGRVAGTTMLPTPNAATVRHSRVTRTSLRQTGSYNNVTLLTIELASPSFASGLPVSTHHVMVLTETQPRIVGNPTRTLAIDEFPVCTAVRPCLPGGSRIRRSPPSTDHAKGGLRGSLEGTRRSAGRSEGGRA